MNQLLRKHKLSLKSDRQFVPFFQMEELQKMVLVKIVERKVGRNVTPVKILKPHSYLFSYYNYYYHYSLLF